MNDDDFFKNAFKGFGAAAIGVIVLNLLFWGGIIWFALWALSQFGVI